MFQCGRFQLDLGTPRIMGILNVTPDSFSDGGRHATAQAAIRKAWQMIEAGADLIDVGGESTRPGAQAATLEEELARVLPVLTALRDAPVPLSIDTMKTEVMRAALDAGASLVNDVNALQAEGALQVLASSDAGVCLMHMQGEPRSMQMAPHYTDVQAEVEAFLAQRVAAVRVAGVGAERIMLDPGIGFGKTLEHNLALLRGLPRLARLGYPLLLGVSRKSMLGAITGKPVDERMAASVAAALYGVMQGVAVVRVHDVAETRDALQVYRTLAEEQVYGT